MPIRPENRDKYPDDWEEISRRIRFERAGGKCEWCGVKHGATGVRESDGTFRELEGMDCEVAALDGEKVIKICLTVAHLDHDPTNNNEENLKALCQRCHNRYDAPMRRAGIQRRRDDARGQQRLFDEDES